MAEHLVMTAFNPIPESCCSKQYCLPSTFDAQLLSWDLPPPLSRRFPSLLWSIFHAFLFFGFFTHLYGVHPPGASWKGGLFARFLDLPSESIFFSPDLTQGLACYRHLGWKWTSFIFWKYCPWSSSFQCCCWEVQSPFNCWSLVCDLFLSLGSYKIFLILKVMKFHNYGRGIFSFVVLGNHWASWISKFTSLQFWKMFSPPCSLYPISFWNLYCWVIGFLGLILWFSSLCSIFSSIFFALLSRDFLTFSFNTSFGFFTSDVSNIRGLFLFPNITFYSTSFFFHGRNIFPEDINVRFSSNWAICFFCCFSVYFRLSHVRCCSHTAGYLFMFKRRWGKGWLEALSLRTGFIDCELHCRVT